MHAEVQECGRPAAEWRVQALTMPGGGAGGSGVSQPRGLGLSSRARGGQALRRACKLPGDALRVGGCGGRRRRAAERVGARI
eukprot:2365225-Rhodomonas_salina.3